MGVGDENAGVILMPISDSLLEEGRTGRCGLFLLFPLDKSVCSW